MNEASHFFHSKHGFALDEDELNIIQEAMDEFETYTCLRWSERDGESDYVNIANENSGCWSYVGKIHTSFQPQTLNLVTRSVSGRTSCLTVSIHIEAFWPLLSAGHLV